MNNRFATLLKDIRQQRKLSAKRHPMYQNNKFGKYFMLLFALIWVGYLVLFGFLLPAIFREEVPGMEPYNVLNGGCGTSSSLTSSCASWAKSCPQAR